MATAADFLLRPRSWQRLFRVAAYATVAALAPSSYGPAARELAVRQVYLSAWKVLPGYLAFTALLSVVLIQIADGALRAYGLAPYSLELVLRVLVLELVPLLTVFFVAFRSGTAVAAEIAVMRVTGELDDTAESGSDELRGELVPRVAATALSVFALTTLGGMLALAITYWSYFHTSRAGFFVFTRVVGTVFDDLVLVGLALKFVLFGAAVALIPIASGLEAERDRMKSVPAVVLAGLMKLVLAILLIEVVVLMVKYV